MLSFTVSQHSPSNVLNIKIKQKTQCPFKNYPCLLS